MKNKLTIYLLAVILSGCAEKRTKYVDQTIRIEAGKDITIRNYVLNVKKREGNSVEGIRIISNGNGNEITITADIGILTEGSEQRIEMPPTKNKPRVVIITKSVKLTLTNANIVTKTPKSTTKSTAEKMELDF